MGMTSAVKILVVIWTLVGVGLCFYLIGFPVFMKKNIAVIVSLLERILENLEKNK
ncbi:MAG: hypothetical protein HY810_01280 [Candidatus Omnitrophica bacterium]|nr:hypothetical protein [Candidatus Omnitrophota bacterium]